MKLKQYRVAFTGNKFNRLKEVAEIISGGGIEKLSNLSEEVVA